jgi:glycosyltransferase involved in cell wall biosynthesis
MSVSTFTLSVIVPAHNEERRIEATIRDLRAALPYSEIIVVVNNSTDRTADIVRSLAAKDVLTRLIDVPAHVGKGGAVRIGFGIATKTHVAFVDADGATSGAEVRRLLAYLEDADCVAASRWLPGATIDVRQSALRRFLSRGFNACVRALFGLEITDTQCGAKLFRRSVLQEILDEIETADFAFDVDLLYAVHRRKLRTKEVPTVWREREGSSVNVRAAVPRMFLSLVRLRLRHSFLRLLLPVFDRSFNLRPMRTRRALRYLVLAPNDGRSAQSTELERHVRTLMDEIASPARDIVWFAADSSRKLLPLPRWVFMMIVYLRRFRDDFDCVLEVVPKSGSFMTPLYCLKPKVVVKAPNARLHPLYTSALIIESQRPVKRSLEEALLLAMTRTTMHLYVDRDGHLVLSECVSPLATRELLIAKAETSA